MQQQTQTLTQQQSRDQQQLISFKIAARHARRRVSIRTRRDGRVRPDMVNVVRVGQHVLIPTWREGRVRLTS